MIYLDSAATTLQKPPSVVRAMDRALLTCANPGRSGHGPALRAQETVFACRELAACRGGWLYLCPAEEVQPAALPRGLLHGVVLSFLRGVLRSGGRAVIRVLPHGKAAVLTLQGGRPDRMPGDLPALLHRCGAYVTTGDGGWYAAAVRMAPAQGLPLREAPALAELLLDRYSAPRVYLQGFCVEEE